MALIISAIVMLVLLATKELIGAGNSTGRQRIANYLYVAIVPSLVFFIIEAALKIAQLPPVSGT